MWCQGRACLSAVRCYPQGWVSGLWSLQAALHFNQPWLAVWWHVCTTLCARACVWVGVYVCVCVCVRVHVRERGCCGYAWKTPGMCWCLHFSPLTGSICRGTIDTVLACFSVKDPGGFLHIWQCLVPLPGESRPMRQWLCYSPQPSVPGHLEASWFVSPAHLCPHAFPISICTSITSSHSLTPAERETFHPFPHYTHTDARCQCSEKWTVGLSSLKDHTLTFSQYWYFVRICKKKCLLYVNIQDKTCKIKLFMCIYNSCTDSL